MTVLLYLKAFYRKRSYLLLSFFFAILVVMLAYSLFFKMIRDKTEEREQAHQSIPVTVSISNIAGTQTDHLEIPFYLAEYFTSEEYSYGGEIQPRALSSYVEDVKMKTTLYYKLSSEEKNSFGAAPTMKKLIGITDLGADHSISADFVASIEFYSGDEKSVFQTKDPVCIIPKQLLNRCFNDEQGQPFLTISVQTAPASQNTMNLTLRVVGVYVTEDNRILCPWSVAADLQNNLEGYYTVDSLSAKIKNNLELPELCGLLSRHFTDVSPTGTAEKMEDSPVLDHYLYAAIVHDETLRQTLKEIGENLKQILWMKPLIIVLGIVISSCCGFFLGFVQRSDMLIARLLGTRMREIVSVAALELGSVFLPAMLTSGLVSVYRIKIEVPLLYSISIGLAITTGCFLSIVELKRVAAMQLTKE